MPDPSDPPPDAAATATPTGIGKFQLRVATGGASFLADEPLAAGGLATGPSPYDLLSAALAACTAMTLRLYAAGKGWELGALQVDVTHAKVKGATPPDHFTRRIAFDPALDPAQRQRLLEIAERCPVHRTLTAGSTIATAEAAP
jgi:putative redox protein